MTRKLLPYEYDMVQLLGITEEEYLEFLAIQAIYEDPKAGTVFDIRNDPVTGISLALTAIGIIFTVASRALAPQPRIAAPTFQPPPQVAPAPSQQGVGGQTQTREQRFSPRFGFNNQQDLAKYGDPVNLIYTDISINPAGGVRAATSLVWSAVRSFGSSQFIQLLMTLSGGGILAIDSNRSAFGQTTLEDLVRQNKWLYFAADRTGFLRWSDETSSQAAVDPSYYGTTLDNPYRIQAYSDNSRIDGFSQAYSPTSQNSFGLYGVVPINVLVYQRGDSGHKQSAVLGIESSWNWTPLQSVAIDFTFTLTLRSTAANVGSVETAAQDERRALASAFDDSAVFKLGSALFRVNSVNTGSTDETDMIVELKCIQAGFAPRTPYSALTVGASQGEQTETPRGQDTPEYIAARALMNALEAEDERYLYQVTQTGTFNEDGYEISTRTVIPFTANTIVAGQPAQGNQDPLLGSDYAPRGPGVYKITWYTYRTSNDQGEYDVSMETGYRKIRDVTAQEAAAFNIVNGIETAIPTAVVNNFFTKALVKVESASYKTAQPCQIVNLAIKSRVYKRVSGRAERYGRDNVGGYPASDNGTKTRVSLFTIKYKRGTSGAFTTVPGIFAVSRAAETENFNNIKFLANNLDHWQFKLEPVGDPEAEVRNNPGLLTNDVLFYHYIQNAGETVAISNGQLYFEYIGRKIQSTYSYYPPLNENPSGLQEWDLFNLDSDNQLQFSFDGGPENVVTCVTEQQIDSFSDYPSLYSNLTLVGLNLFSGRNLQDLRSFTAYVTKGRKVRRLLTAGSGWGGTNFNYLPAAPDGPTSYAPDIFLDTVLDSVDGIGKYAVLDGVDLVQLARSKRYCEVNNFYMDGIIADTTNWRSFWADTAPMCLLEFARIGGKETLVPALPYNPTTGAITRQINVSALFNQGNIIEGSYKEEYLDYGSNVQDIIATIIYRDANSSGAFSINRTVEVRRKDITEADSVRQTFYVSQFVTSANQAILYGKLLCNNRHYIKRAVEFKTFPSQDIVSPGAYIYVDVGLNAWNGIRTGIVRPGGVLNIPLDNALPIDTYKFLLYRSGAGVVSGEYAVASNTAIGLAAYDGWIFVLGNAINSKRVFRVEEVQMDEEGEVTVSASEYPCDTNGNSLIADFDDALFTVLD